ncbi:MAG: energy transducer TonB [Bacteroidota bacterium]|nr:energy transducer TonB [Bacteroidota bacterium]
MKRIILFCVLFGAATSFAQTPKLYDTWTTALMGSMIRITITEHEIIASPVHGSGAGMPQFLSVPSPNTGTSGSKEETRSETRDANENRMPLLKVIFDSAQAKGRLFLIQRKGDSTVEVGYFLITDRGEMVLSAEVHGFGASNSQENLSEAIKATGKNPGGLFAFTMYNSKLTAEYEKLKDPLAMQRPEMFAIINSFGDRLSARLQQLPQDSAKFMASIMNESVYVGAFTGTLHDLFLAHGYNPLRAEALIEKVGQDSDIKAAIKVTGERIEESVPALRALKKQRLADEENGFRTQIEKLQKAYRAREDYATKLVARLKGHFSDREALESVLKAVAKAQSVSLTSEMLKDSVALSNHMKSQQELDDALGKISGIIQGHSKVKTKEDVIKLMTLGSDVRMAQMVYDDQAEIYNESHPEKLQYRYFTPHSSGSGSADTMMAMTTEVVPAPAPAAPVEEAEPARDEFIEVTKEPEPIENIQSLIVYPEEAKKAGLEGKVTFEVLIGKTGKVEKVDIVKSDNLIFNQAVLDAISKVHFKPALQNTTPVRIWYTQSVSFRLN